MNAVKQQGFVAVFSFLFFMTCFNGVPVFAQRPPEGLGKWLQEVGVFTGFAAGKLKRKGHLEAYPVGMRFGFDLIPFLKKFGLEPKGMFEVVYEPFISTIVHPEANIEFGLPIFLKYSYPLTEKLYPFLELGTGPYYMSLRTVEQSTHFNFIDQAGIGISYFLKENLAIQVTYRYRHVSNFSIREPNNGIEASVYLVGMSWYY